MVVSENGYIKRRGGAERNILLLKFLRKNEERVIKREIRNIGKNDQKLLISKNGLHAHE